MANYDFTMFDAAVPPWARPAGTVATMGYIGGRATHTWTPQQWRPFASTRQFPAWVADLSKHPAQQADAAVAAALALGWAAHEPAPGTRAIIYDLEDQADAAWYAVAASTTALHGFTAVVYGSLSTVLQNAASDVLAAKWDDSAVIPEGQTIHGKQYKDNVQYGSTVIDYSVIDQWLMQRGGVGIRKGA
jgi:hypothetical protein